MTLGLTLPIVAAGIAGAKAYGDMQQSMSMFRSVTGATAGQMKAAGAEAVKLGNDTRLPGTSASDAATAMLELGKGGMNAAQAMAAARPTLIRPRPPAWTPRRPPLSRQTRSTCSG